MFQPKVLNGPFAATMPAVRKVSRNGWEAGWLDADGQPVAFADSDTDHLVTLPPAPDADMADAEVLDGPALLGGAGVRQFGHVLINCTGRLWALDLLPQETTVVFVAKHKPVLWKHPHIRSVMKWLGYDNPVVMTHGPLRLARAYSAGEIFGERYGGRGSPEFYAWLDGRLPEPPPMEPGRAVYVTRSGLGAEAGRFACEDHLERLLAAAGFEIYMPERHPLAHQVDTFRRAERLVFAEGSALHLFAMVRRAGQKVAVIKRRPDLPPLIETQLADRTGEEAAVIDAISKVMWPPRRGDYLSVALLDFDALREGLVAAGVLERGAAWSVPRRRERLDSMQAGLAEGEKMLTPEEHAVFLSKMRRAKRMAAAE